MRGRPESSRCRPSARRSSPDRRSHRHPHCADAGCRRLPSRRRLGRGGLGGRDLLPFIAGVVADAAATYSFLVGVVAVGALESDCPAAASATTAGPATSVGCPAGVTAADDEFATFVLGSYWSGSISVRVGCRWRLLCCWTRAGFRPGTWVGVRVGLAFGLATALTSRGQVAKPLVGRPS